MGKKKLTKKRTTGGIEGAGKVLGKALGRVGTEADSQACGLWAVVGVYPCLSGLCVWGAG